MKFNKYQKKVLRNAIEKYGFENQKIIAIEEMSELQKEICKTFREDFGYKHDNIVEEMADVYIMLEQLKMIFEKYINIDFEIENQIDAKINRLNLKIKEFSYDKH